MDCRLPLRPLFFAVLAMGALAACSPSQAIARYCAEKGYVEGSTAFQDCVAERQSVRRLRYLKGGGGAGAGG